MEEGYSIRNVERIDSPLLVVYPDRVSGNIDLAKRIVGDPARLRPHVKTSKTTGVCRLLFNVGIRKFKCATIAEAEMLGQIAAPDVLLADQPVGSAINRLLRLVRAYFTTHYACLIDQAAHASVIAARCAAEGITLDVYLDLNVGMNRTGIRPELGEVLVEQVLPLSSLRIVGLHAYDGHIHDADLSVRRQKAEEGYAQTERLYQAIRSRFAYPLTKVIGGIPTFPVYAERTDCECSPGTFVFWDWGYGNAYPDMPFRYAALLLTRVISIVDERHICLDLGYKSIASGAFLESPRCPSGSAERGTSGRRNSRQWRLYAGRSILWRANTYLPDRRPLRQSLRDPAR